MSQERTASPVPVASSFRDPSGFLYERGGRLLRQVNRSFADTFDAVVNSGLYDVLMEEGLLVDHAEVDPALAATAEGYRILEPRRLPFISYPYEWCPGQLRDAALLTLRIQDLALDHGMSLRDASAYNVQFEGGRPVFIDTLSFEPRREGAPWVAYRQFCQHFLAPLALQTLVDVRLSSLLTTHIDGVPLDLAARLLPLRTRFSPGLLTHIHGQARASGKREADASAQRPRQARFSLQALRGLVDSLRSQVNKLTWDLGRTTWSDYYAQASHYSEQAMAHKLELVGEHLDRLSPSSVWDLGANTGRFSRLAAERGARTVAFDVDHGAVEAAWQDLREDPVHTGTVLPLVLDLSTPSPAIGWANRERDALADRGPADVVMALALMHHLAIGNNVPLPRIAQFLAELGEHVIIEFVPKQDPKVQVLLATREDVFDDYTPEGFTSAFATHFDTLDVEPVQESARTLHLLRRR